MEYIVLIINWILFFCLYDEFRVIRFSFVKEKGKLLIGVVRFY